MAARHWTNDELMAHLYGVGPEDGHLEECMRCAGRLEQMQAARRSHESLYREEEAGFEFLAAQRRRVYQRLTQPAPGRLARRFAPALAASLVIAGGLLVYQQKQDRTEPAMAKYSDTQLVEEVGRVAMNPEPAPTAPLQALFEQ